jgi:hypothetical protein
LKSLLYAVEVESHARRKASFLGVVFGALGNLSLRLPALSPAERAHPLGPAEVLREAVNLEDPRTGRIYSAPEALAGLSSDEVAHLDVRSDHPLWWAERELERSKAEHGSAWRAFEARLEARVSEAIGAPYELDRARRILLFDSVRSSGTSPKIEAEDLHGQEWTVKWGDEVQAEALANHLYIELGGKFADWNHANKGGPRDLVLVLGGEVRDLDDLERALRESQYEFDVSAHVVGQGVITEEMLEQEPFTFSPRAKTELVGRHFLTFNESLVEFQAGAGFLRFGAGAMSSAGALDDRVKRGLAVFTYWIHNKDAKDINGKGVIDRRSSTFLEYMHDLGASLGSLRTAGNPNLLTVGVGFVRRRGGSIRFGENMLYLPKAFERATHADALWMTRKIVALPREALLAAVAATRWPDFQQDVMASRLIARRNALARAFDVGSPVASDAVPTVVSLSTPSDRLAAVRRYDLSIPSGGDEAIAVARLEGFMQESGIPILDGQASFEDEVDRWKGKPEAGVLETTPCQESVLVAWLERTLHPSGLSRRSPRGSDDRPLEPCLPTRRSLQNRPRRRLGARSVRSGTQRQLAGR